MEIGSLGTALARSRADPAPSRIEPCRNKLFPLISTVIFRPYLLSRVKWSAVVLSGGFGGIPSIADKRRGRKNPQQRRQTRIASAISRIAFDRTNWLHAFAGTEDFETRETVRPSSDFVERNICTFLQRYLSFGVEPRSSMKGAMTLLEGRPTVSSRNVSHRMEGGRGPHGMGTMETYIFLKEGMIPDRYAQPVTWHRIIGIRTVYLEFASDFAVSPRFRRFP